MLEFVRVVTPQLLDAVRPGGPFDLLVGRVATRPEADVQLRCTVDRTISGATLYLGLTAALTLEERGDQFRLQAHPTHQAAAAFDPAWATWQPLDGLAAQAPAVDAYLDRLLTDGTVDPRWFAREGVVQAVLSHPGHATFGVVQREASVWSHPPKDAVRAAQVISDRMWNAVAGSGRSDPWWPGVRDRGKRPGMGRSVDVLGVDDGDRLAVIEVKPAAETAKIPWAAAQVGLYGELFAAWWADNPSARADMQVMAEQRHRLGLLDARWCEPFDAGSRVASVLAIGGGTPSRESLPRLAGIAEALDAVPSTQAGCALLDPLEIWLHDDDGTLRERWVPSEGPPPKVR